jgi:hypothetical protein
MLPSTGITELVPTNRETLNSHLDYVFQVNVQFQDDMRMDLGAYNDKTERLLRDLKNWLMINIAGYDPKNPFASAVFGVMNGAIAEGFDTKKRLTAKEIVHGLIDLIIRGVANSSTIDQIKAFARQVVVLSKNDPHVQNQMDNVTRNLVPTAV